MFYDHFSARSLLAKLGSDAEEDVELSEEYFRYKLEEYWNYHDEESGKLVNEVTEECSELKTYTGEGEFHDLPVKIDIEDNMDARKWICHQWPMMVILLISVSCLLRV